MKQLIFAAALLGAALPALAQANVSIEIGQPGFYGRIDLGDFRRPPVVYAQPIVIERRVRYDEPVYLRVPPGHMKNWRKHCGRYDACGRRVYFVRDEWYSNTYAPRYRERQRPRAVHVMEERHSGPRQMVYDDGRDDGHGKHKDKHKDKHHDKHDKHGGKGHGKHKD